MLPVGDVQMSAGITIFLGQTKVNNMNLVALTPKTHKKVIWLDIAVQKVLAMNVLDARNHLVGQQEHRLKRELAVAKVEQVFERRSQKVNDHGVVLASALYTRASYSSWGCLARVLSTLIATCSPLEMLVPISIHSTIQYTYYYISIPR